MDTETEIAAQVAQNIPKEDSPITNPAPAPEPEPAEPLHNGLPLDGSLQRGELMDYFELPASYRMNPEVLQQIDTIIGWARENASGTELADIFRVIGRHETLLGIRHSPGRISKLNRYIRLQSQSRALDEQMRAMYAGV
jgi:hypothetical protein